MEANSFDSVVLLLLVLVRVSFIPGKKVDPIFSQLSAHMRGTGRPGAEHGGEDDEDLRPAVSFIIASSQPVVKHIKTPLIIKSFLCVGVHGQKDSI